MLPGIRYCPPLPPIWQAAVEMARAQYSSPCVLCAAEDITKAIVAPGESIPAAAKVPVPIVAIAAKQEALNGETAAKMEAWEELTSSGSFELTRDVDCTHMGLPKDARTKQIVVAALKKVVEAAS